MGSSDEMAETNAEASTLSPSADANVQVTFDLHLSSVAQSKSALYLCFFTEASFFIFDRPPSLQLCEFK